MLRRFLDKTSNLVYKPFFVIAFGFALTVFFLYFIPFVKLDNNITNMIPKSNKARQTFEKYEKIFGNPNLIFIGIEAKNIYDPKVLKYVKKVSDEVNKINSDISIKMIQKFFHISSQDANAVIGLLSELELNTDKEKLEILKNSTTLENDFFLDHNLAYTLSTKMKSISLSDVYSLYNPPIKEVSSLFTVDYIRGEHQKFIVKKIINGPISPKNIQVMKKNIQSWNVYDKTLISQDHTLTTILVQFYSVKNAEVRSTVYKEIKTIINKNKPKEVKVFFSGESVISDSVSDFMIKDIQFLLPIVIMVIILALYLSFRSLGGVVYPLLTVIISTIWTIGLMSLFKVPLNMISIVMPVLLVAVGSAYGIHFFNSYIMSNHNNPKLIIQKNISDVGLSITMAGLTTVAGFGSLVFTSFIPIRTFGIFTGIGVFLALIVTLYFMSTLMVLFQKKTTLQKKVVKANKILENILEFLHRISIKKSKLVVIVSIIILLISIYGITKIKVGMDIVSFFKKTSPVRQADIMLNEKLAGTQNLNIVLESKKEQNILTPEILKKIEKLEIQLKQKFSEIGKIISINDYIKKMNQEMYNGDSTYYRIPKTQKKIRDYLLLYSGNLSHFVTERKDKILISLSIQRTSTETIKKIKNEIEAFFDTSFLEKHNIQVVITGISDIYIAVNNLIVNGQLFSLFSALIVVFLINLLVFRKLVISLISLIPLSLALVINFGLMGWLHIPLDAATAMIASVSIGIGIDYAIHIIVKYLDERKKNKTVSVSIHDTLLHTGRGILFNIFSVTAGFLVLLLSHFVPLIEFGALVSLTMITTGIGSLLIIPAILVLIEKQGRIS